MQYLFVFGIILTTLFFWLHSLQLTLNGISENNGNAMVQIGLHLSSEWEILSELLLLVEIWAPDKYLHLAAVFSIRKSISKTSTVQDVKRQEEQLLRGKVILQEIAAYCPELRDDPVYIEKMNALHRYENMVFTSLLIYNDTVAKLNSKIHIFPISVVARVLGFSTQSQFEVIN